jgi:hypothetical protein
MDDFHVSTIKDVTPASDRGSSDRHEDFVILALLSHTGPGSEDPVSIHLTNKAARQLKAHLDRLLLG